MSSRFLADAPVRPDAARGRGILFCGTWTDVKGVRYLADAFSQMVAPGVAGNLTILGGAVPADEIRASFAAEARGRLTVLDRVAEEEVMAAYRSHDVLAFPSTYEGFGMVLVEAMSQRLPVVATPVGCARTLVVDGVTGLWFRRAMPAPSQPHSAVLDDAALRARLSTNGLSGIHHLTWTRTATQTLEAYGRVDRPRKADRSMNGNGPKRLLTIGHSYAVTANRRLGRRVGSDRRMAGHCCRPAEGSWRLRLAPARADPRRTTRARPGSGALHPRCAPHGLRVAACASCSGSRGTSFTAGRSLYVAAAAQVAAGPPKPLVFATFQNIDKQYPPPFRWFERYAAARASGAIAYGQTVQEVLKAERLAGLPIRVIPPGVDTTRSRLMRRRARTFANGSGGATRPVVGFLGRLVPEKGLGLL